MTTSVDKRSDLSGQMLQHAADGRVLMAGEKAMRAAGETYLPKFDAENDSDYKARINSSWFFNGYLRTVQTMTGKVFDQPVELGEGIDRRIVDWSMDIDLQGNDLSVFARNVFEDAISGAGISYVMVDAPARDADISVDQAAQENLRPYFVHLRVEDVLGWKSESINNVQTLTQLRILETIKEQSPDDEFAEEEIEQVRVLDRTETTVQTRIYRETSGQWALFGEPTFSDMTEITVVPFYANRSGFFTGEPVLADLGTLNMAHWRSQSDYDYISHFANVPVMHISGRQDDGPIKFSASTAIVSDSNLAKIEWVEHKGQAIPALERKIDRIESQMERFGLQLLVPQSGSQSATGEALDAKKETSTLAMTADQLKDTLERALNWMAEYGGITGPAIEAKVNKEFGAWPITPQELTVLQKDVAMGYLSLEAYYEIRKQRGILRPDLDVKQDMEQAGEEAGEGLTDA